MKIAISVLILHVLQYASAFRAFVSPPKNTFLSLRMVESAFDLARFISVVEYMTFNKLFIKSLHNYLES